MRTFIYKLVTCLSLLFVGASIVGAQGRKPVSETIPAFSAWAAYWDGARARQALFVSASRLEEVDVFAYHFAADDTLVPAHANVKDLREAFHQLPGRKPRMAITIVNDIENPAGIQLKNPACVHRVLSTPAAPDAHIQQILTIAEGADSIDIDYERVAPEDGPAFTSFIVALAAALHHQGKRLSVVVEPRVSEEESASDPLSGSSNALSWQSIARAADQLTIMAYLYHYGSSGPGSIAPIDWISQVADYGLLTVPTEKLAIALHLGGFDWPKDGTGQSLDYAKAAALAAAYGKSIQLDKTTQSGTFSYSDGSSTHEVWIETAAGLQAKIDALSAAGINHIALWRLGSGDPAFWDKMPSPKVPE